MNQTSEFQYDQFASLERSDLSAYMERFANDPTIPLTPDDLQRMLSELPNYDEYHLVYALEVGGDRSPDTFAPSVPAYLTHGEMSVRLAAANVLERLPDAVITRSLVDSVLEALLKCPEGESLKSLRKLETRITREAS